MERRQYGATGERLSVVGFGGILVMNESAETSSRLVSQAIDRGINYFDVAPNYGNAQEMLGPALEPYRNDVFLACKTQERTAAESQKELEESLKLLKTDHVDLYQFHAVKTTEDVSTILGPGGAMETFLKAREHGKVRYLGFSAHSEEAALALLDAFTFDSILFPVNWVTWFKGKFGPRVLPAAKEKGAAVLALKTLAKRTWGENEKRTYEKAWYHPVDTYEEALLGFKFTMSRGVTAAVSPGHENLLWWACDAAEEYTPLTAAEEAELERRAKDLDPIFAV
jgi:aryl-alcohol dehydrogenase-like predicted oxidoreductase